jgi:hypothetical protein
MILRVHLRELNDFVLVDTATVEPQCIVTPVEPLYKTMPIDAGDVKKQQFSLGCPVFWAKQTRMVEYRIQILTN